MLLSFNVCRGKYYKSSEKLIKFIFETNPSVICLQESSKHIVNDIKSLNCYSNIELPSKKDPCYNSTLIRDDITIKDVYSFKLYGLHRHLLFSKIILNDKPLLIGNLHLKSGRNCSNIRKIQVKQLLDNIKDDEKYVVLAGDWNLGLNEISWPFQPICSPYSPNPNQYNQTDNTWMSHDLYPTFRSANKNNNSTVKFDYPFDRFLVKGINISDFQALNGEEFSDHDIIIMSLKDTINVGDLVKIHTILQPYINHK